MLYAFPKNFYKKGAQSKCYSSGNTVLSDGDVALLKMAYGEDTRVNPGASAVALVQAAQALSTPDRASLVDRLKFFNANQANKSQVMRIGDARFTDIDIKACSATNNSKELVEQVTQILNNEPKLGMLRYRGIGGASAPGITVFADFDHPEMEDAKRVTASLSSRFGNHVSLADNPGNDRWLLTIIVCGANENQSNN